MSTIPFWFSKRNKAIAQVLLDAGFCYSGRVEDFTDADYQESVGQWAIGTYPGAILISADCDGATFSKSMELLPHSDFESEWKNTKRLIRCAGQSWDDTRNYSQLELPV